MAKDRHNTFFGMATGRILYKRLIFNNDFEGFEKLQLQAEAFPDLSRFRLPIEKFNRMKVKKIKFSKEKKFLDGYLPGRNKIISKIKDVVEQFGIFQER